MTPIADKVRASVVFRRMLDEAETAAACGQDLRFYDPRELPAVLTTVTIERSCVLIETWSQGADADENTSTVVVFVE